MSKKYSPKL